MNLAQAALTLARRDGLIPLEDAPPHIQAARSYIHANLVRLSLGQGVVGVGTRASYTARVRETLELANG